jgi:hypothetical protein
MHVESYFKRDFPLKVTTTRARILSLWRSSHSRRHTNTNACADLGIVQLISDIDAGFSKAEGGNHPAATATLQALPGKFANIGTAFGSRADEAASERSFFLGIIVGAGGLGAIL